MNNGCDFPGAPPAGGRRYSARLRAVAALFVAVAGLAGTVSLAFFFYPPKPCFYSRVTIEKKRNPNTVQVLTPDKHRPPNAGATCFQAIRCPEVLFPVIAELKLARRWSPGGRPNLSKEQACSRLLARMRLESLRNTGLIQIGVYSSDRQEAADIANAIAQTYQKLAHDDQMKIRDTALEQLGEEVAARDQAVKRAWEEMKWAAQKDNYVDPKPEEWVEVGTPAPSEWYKNAKRAYLRARQGLEQATARLKTANAQLTTTITLVQIREKAEPAAAPEKSCYARAAAKRLGAGLAAGLAAAGLFLFFTRPRRMAA